MHLICSGPGLHRAGQRAGGEQEPRGVQLQVKRGVACIFCLCVTGGLDIPFGLGPRKVKGESVHVLVLHGSSVRISSLSSKQVNEV